MTRRLLLEQSPCCGHCGTRSSARWLLHPSAPRSLKSAKTADMDGRTPLHVAAMHASTKVAEWLLREGAEVNALDSFYRTPLYLASEREHTETQVLLVRCCGSDNLLLLAHSWARSW